MSSFVDTMKNRIDLMTSDQIIYLLLPELLAMKDIAEDKDDVIKLYEIEQVVEYVRTKVQLDDFKIYEEFGNTKFIVPSPTEIIEGISPKGIPNN